jgi:hypothetical protein
MGRSAVIGCLTRILLEIVLLLTFHMQKEARALHQRPSEMRNLDMGV